MPAPSEHILIAAMNQIRRNLLTLGRHNGYRHDYRGVRTWMYDYPIEADLERPWVQAELGEAASNLVSNTLTRVQRRLYLRAHILGDHYGDGEIDVNTPALNVIADFEQRMMLDRSQGSTVLDTQYDQDECTWERFMANDQPGVTVTEAYILEYHWLTGDMGTAP